MTFRGVVAMKCPKCQAECREFQIEPNLKVDACHKCRGYWFDQGELGATCRTGADLPFSEDLAGGRQTGLPCTKCTAGQLVEIPYKPSHNLLVDVCSSCRGVWLDQNELGQVKQLAKSAPSRSTNQASRTQPQSQSQPQQDVWYYAEDNKPIGPVSVVQLTSILATKGLNTLVYKDGMKDWAAAASLPEFAEKPRSPVPHNIGVQSNPSSPQYFRSQADGIIDYQIHGESIQFVEMELDPGEMVISEPGALMYMAADIQMDTMIGDPSKENEGIMGKIFSAGKRMITGESMFISSYQNVGHIKHKIAFAAPFPGQIIPFELEKFGSEIICQSRAFICAARGVQINIAFQKRIMTGLFGGEGFIMQRLSGTGVAMLHAGGSIIKKTLGPNEKIKVDTGCLVALNPSVNYEVEMVRGVKNIFFGGEGLFLATLKGPGDVWLQSMPITKLVQQLHRISTASGLTEKKSASLVSTIGDIMNG